jgi:hypothetical protein
VDQPNCASTVRNRTTYACVSQHSLCRDESVTSTDGYNCICKAGYAGNPFVQDGCSSDKGIYYLIKRSSIQFS